ncbi:MAG: trifunctional transcriptional regulator/proline dehydrogenase/L-glutamate gamma-semialdehyde dehydrogenase [Gammaproteobacteria bacterium]|nr:trifunctional transcriptional regulator/proline dehydrogenase/L-glutamate gamma-semialdehyde dehydrogenase [Gammaproteobacteria bacterium]
MAGAGTTNPHSNSPLANDEQARRDRLRQAITAAYRRDEPTCMHALIAQLQSLAPSVPQILERARRLVTAVRDKRTHASGVDMLMHEFSLSNQEGIALMCLAEALLRIPDADTADRLIRDKISKGDWKAHLGHSPSLFVNAAAWGLLISGKLVATRSEHTLGNALLQLIAKGGEPLIRKGVDIAMRLLGEQFVIGETIQQALDRSVEHELRGYRYSYDMLGEAALTAADADRYCRAYEHAIHTIGQAAASRGLYRGPGISIKLSALHPRYSRAQRERVLTELLPRLWQLLRLAQQYDIGVNIDAEESERLDLSLDLLERLALDADLRGWHGIGFVVQAYQKRAPFVIDYLVDLAQRSGHRLMIRLVKGAYWDSEIKHAQVDGLDGYPVYTRKAHTDVAYLACAHKLLIAGDAVYPQFATHNAHTVSAVYQMALDTGVSDYEFQCLHGMGESLYDEVVGSDKLDKPCRIYGPVGNHETLLPYLVRRLLENGANSSFVNRLVDETISIDTLIADPLIQTQQWRGQPHPQIPLPHDLYGATRRNSSGVDLANESVLASVQRELDALTHKLWETRPLLASGRHHGQDAERITNPADRRDHVGSVVPATLADVETALAAATAFAPQWQRTPIAERAAMLERAAELLEQHRPTLISLCIREAGKTWPNAIGEVREAVDFCRYYAQQMRANYAQQTPAALGPVVCISPWNFPLAIFVGEVAAALVAGNPVLAKPAEQTPLVAGFAVTVLHQAGVPPAALQFLPGAGDVVGAALVADARVRGIVFTGSTEVAQHINRALAKRTRAFDEIPFIAETGGQNAMVVDSSALPEQVVQDALASAFDSAGQRCSALRVLCVQNDIADKLIELLKGAMRELRVGNPAQLSTDVGPVIDGDAQQTLLTHIRQMRDAGQPVYQLSLPADGTHGTFVPPTLIEIDAITTLKREVFGPVLHVLRFERDRLVQVLNDINATGYGLTFGLHTRIDESIDLVTTSVHAGNIYVNRNMIGAVVGVQPFGGEGLSGTGPKAGGPLYLQRLLQPKSAAPISRPGTIGEPPAPVLAMLAEWAQASGRRELAETCSFYATTTLLGKRLPLPGPTGESNTLVFAARGTVACIATTESVLLSQIAACLATGNRLTFGGSTPAIALLDSLPPAIGRHIEFGKDWRTTPTAAVLFAGDVAAAERLRMEIAACDGALIPFISADTTQRYPLLRLLVERVISVNTAAAGGNAGLMTLGN